ncbi:MAG: nuclear transport factor 2 family protein [Hyphomonadaceae bacterium]|nr:nuclear transport factor 2 family protein [Hyphomonadaceae bacterium]
MKDCSRRTLGLGALALALAPGEAHARRGVSRIEALLIRDECASLVLSYAHALDASDAALMNTLFAPDAVWEADGRIRREGADALHALWAEVFSARRPTVGRHVVSNIRTNVLDRDHAAGTAFVTMYRYNPNDPQNAASLAPLLLVSLDLEYVRIGEAWRFKRVSLTSAAVANYVHGQG